MCKSAQRGQNHDLRKNGQGVKNVRRPPRIRKVTSCQCKSYRHSLPCMVSPQQHILLSSGKYRPIEELNPYDEAIDAVGRARQVRSVAPTQDYMGSVFVTTKKSLNRVDIPRRNSILVLEKKNENWEDDVYNVNIDFATSLEQRSNPVWVPVQNLTERGHTVFSANFSQTVPLTQTSKSYSTGFLIGAFLTCGCRRFDNQQTWSQFILDVGNDNFQCKLRESLHILHSEVIDYKKQTYRCEENMIENSQTMQLNVYSSYVEHLVYDIDDSRRDIPDGFMTYGIECLQGIYDSIIHSNHYYSNSLVYDACVHLESILGKEEARRKRGDIIEISNDHVDQTNAVNLVFTDTDDRFASLICNHIPMATYPRAHPSYDLPLRSK